MSVTKDHSPAQAAHQDLEKQQYEVLYKEMDVPLLDIRKQYFSTFLMCALFLLLLTLLFASFVKIPNYLQVPIVMKNTMDDHIVLFNHLARVEEHFVKIGDYIEKDQAISRISSPEIQNLISAIQLAENNIKVLKDYDAKNIDVQIKNIDTQHKMKNKKLEVLQEEKRAAISLYHAQKAVLTSELDYAKMLSNKNKALYEEGLVSELVYLDAEKKYADKLHDQSILEKTHLQALQQFEIRAQVVNEALLTNSIKQTELESKHQLDEHKLREQIDLAQQKLALFYGSYQLDAKGLILLAPMAGKITYYHPDHQLLQIGEILYRLELSQGRFESTGYLQANDIGYVKSEMETKVMLETFPHYEWGSLSGRIKELSVSPNAKGQYTLAIDIIDENDRITPLLQNGQTGTASIIIEKKSLFSYLFRDFRKLTSELVH